MDEHSIPQNVTSFEFHLIGDMTLKQFAYLASGLAIAYLTFITIFSKAPLLAIPIIGVSSLTGIAFAFLPILDRPLDHWVSSYFKAIFSPTQGVWQSPLNPRAKLAPNDPLFLSRLPSYLASIGEKQPVFTQPASFQPVAPQQAPAPRPIFNQPITRLTPAPTPTIPAPTPGVAPSALPTKEELDKLVVMAKQAQELQVKVAAQQQEITKLKSSLGSPAQPPIPVLTVPVTKPDIKVIEPIQQVKTQLLLTSTPNVINGIVTDISGNYLEGVIVIIHNKENLPVRALKTNKLGQFTGATPLPPGEYTITLEKDTLEFDTFKTILNDTVLSPIMISAKKGGSLGK